MQSIALRPRTATEIVDTTFRLCRAHYGALVTATFVIIAPTLILKILPLGVSVLADPIQNLLYAVTDGAVVAIVSEVYLGRAAMASTGLRAVRGRIGSLIGASIARSLLVALGLLLLIVPGIIMLAGTFALPMAIVLEGHKMGPAFTRSRQLVEHNLWHVLRTLALLALIVFGLMIGAAMVLAVAGEFLGVDEMVTDLIMDGVLILLYPLFSVGGTLLYYDLRIRKEGFDLEMMLRDLGGEPSATVAPEITPTPSAG
jgi:hypothetical protein